MSGELDQDFWAALRNITAARIGLRRAGASVATAPLLDFKLAHARARDAVHESLDEGRLLEEIKCLDVETLAVASAAEDRQRFLLRPDLGRTLSHDAEGRLAALAGDFDIAFVVADGLSARAVQTHAQPVLAGVIPVLRTESWRIAPIVVVRHGRVAIGDAIALLLNAGCVAILVGERPGLSAPDSMGAYLTRQPRPDTIDADRNCISNIRPDGINYGEAAFKILNLLRAMRAQAVSGVRLKDNFDPMPVAGQEFRRVE